MKRLSNLACLILPLVIFCGVQATHAGEANLRVIRSRHYQIHTDLDSTLAFELANRMDVMYEEYAKRLSDFTTSELRQTILPVYLFQKKEDYSALTRHMFPNTAGVFIAGERNLLASFLEGQGRDSLRRTLQHEAFHQFAFFAIGPGLPVWANEGIAQFFEEGLWTGRSFLVNQIPPRRVRQLQTDIADHRLIDFTTMLSMSHQQWLRNLAADPDKGATEYNEAWAMIQFLVSRPDLTRRMDTFLQLIHNGDDPDVAFTTAFSNDIAGFQNSFIQWAQRLTATPEATVLERMDILGDMRVVLQEDGRRVNNMLEFRAAVMGSGLTLEYTLGTVHWKTDPNAQIYFSDLSNRLYGTSDLYFLSGDGPLPDIICRPASSTFLRTHFYNSAGRIEHEVLIERDSQ